MTQILRRTWNKICFRPWTVPIGLFVLLIVSFGWLIPSLGFYWDDWPVILTARLRGIDGFWRFFDYNRPLSAWIYVVTVPILGARPLNWQIFALVLRWLSCVTMWWTVTLTWPKHRQLTASAAFLFAIYPIFAQQSISVAYTQHWMCYFLFFLSMGGMLLAYRISRHGSRWFWPLMIGSLAAFLLEILSMEYFAGLELLRPLLLWLVASEEPGSRAARLKSVLRTWVPYLAGTVGFLIWRFFFIKLARVNINKPRLLAQMLATPVESIKHFAQMALQDLLFLFTRAWTDLFNTTIDLNNYFLLLTWVIAILTAAGAFIFLYRLEENYAGQPGKSNIAHQFMLIGALAAVLGIFPVWATDRQATAGMYADRFGLASMFGTSLFLAGLVSWLLNDRRKQVMIFSLLVGLAAAYHIQTANDYRWVWTKQTRFYWELKWRAPELEPHTAIFSEGEIFSYMGLYPTSAAVNILYRDHLKGEDLPYWFYSLGRNFAYSMPDFMQGVTARGGMRNYSFTGNTHDGIVIQYVPGNNDCLEILAPGDEAAPGLEPFTQQAVPYSNLSRILPGPGVPGTPSTEVFGPEPEHGWCYFYEKASLARQQGDWAQVVAIGEQARASGLNPKASSSNTAFEWLPFIEGYARIGKWQDAQDLSLAAYEKDKRIDALMCSLWDKLAKIDPSSTAGSSAAAAVHDTIQCPE